MMNTAESTLTEAEQQVYDRWLELKYATGLTAEERAERTARRLQVAAVQYADHVFPAAVPDEEPDLETKPDSFGKYGEEPAWMGQHIYAFFPNAPDASVFTGQVITGDRARQLHARLFGSRRVRCAAVVRAPRRSNARPRQRRDGSRRHSTRGSTDDSGPGEPPGALDAPGLQDRLCAICGTDISHRRAGAQTCEDSAHQRQWLRERKKRAVDAKWPEHTACGDCGRRWLSDLDPLGRRCPECGGMLVLGQTRRHQPHSGHVGVPADPLSGVHRDILDCVNANGDASPLRYREPIDFPVTSPPECWSRSCRLPATGHSAFCAEHTQLDDAKSHDRLLVEVADTINTAVDAAEVVTDPSLVTEVAASLEKMVETVEGYVDNVAPFWWPRLPEDLPDATVAALLGLPFAADLAVAA